MSIAISILLTLATYAVKAAITAIYEARKLNRPNIRDKEGTRAYLENLIRWVQYIQGTFFNDMKTPAFTFAVLLEIVKPGERWDAFYDALCHDFNVTTSFPPQQYAPKDEEPRERKIRRLCIRLLNPNRGGQELDDFRSATPAQVEEAEMYLSLVKNMMDQPLVLGRVSNTYSIMKNR